MVSVVNKNDFELDRKSDKIEGEAQSKSKGRVSGDGDVESPDNVVNGDGDKGPSSFDLIGSEENRVSGDDADSYDNAILGEGDEGKSLNFVGSEEFRVSVELENRVPESDVHGRFSVGVVNNLENIGSEKTRVSEVDWEMKSGASDTSIEDATQKVSDHNFSARNSRSEQWGSRVDEVGINSEEKGLHKVDEVWNGGVGHSGSRVGKGHAEGGKSGVSHYDSLISMFDDEFAGYGKGKVVRAGLSTCVSVGYGYEIGDMVWGKVKSHPWWPGHIYNEAFASPSVRRSKRAGHVLVAFFGDSSYGWFDPAELVLFDSNFSEKCRQTSSRNFVKAVEEAVDEASRRRGLGLACRCRNPYNFRSTNVQGYFVVDVYDYEPGGVYSMGQIRKARDNFQPRGTLDFMKQLALMPRSDGPGNIDFVMNKATVLAYRKAVFEEFDETYAQAFGQQPVRPSRPPMESVAQPVRAPLSGPLVIAEALGKRKNSKKPNKAKDQANKDRYLFKRRDEPNDLKIQQIGEETPSMQPAYVEGSVELAPGDYMLQNRALEVSTKQKIPAKLERMATTGMDGASASSRDATGGEVVTVEDKPAVTIFSAAGSLAIGSKVEPPASFSDSFSVSPAPSYTSHGLEPKSDVDKGKGALLEAKATSKLVEGFQQPPSLAAVVVEHGQEGQEHVYSGGGDGHVLPAIDAKFRGQDSRMRIGTGAKKAKHLKRSVGELGAEKSVPGEKKKRKKELGMAMSSDRLQKQSATGKGGASLGRVTGKSVQVGLPPREDFQIDFQKKDDGTDSSLLPDSFGTWPMVGMGNIELKLPRLLGDLQALALNPFHAVERSGPAIIRQAFLKFRSLVYQKSLVLSTPSEVDSNEVHASKSPAASSSYDSPPSENIRDLPSSKPSKPLVRRDDPTKGGRKRGPSDRQEELAVKRLKKITDMKSLAAEKKAAQKTPEAQRDAKETVAPRPAKLLKADSVKKTESLAKAPEPTMLVMKFPPKTTLPSGSELKARLARFGPLDHSNTRIFWKSSTCRVVFIHRVDAEAAHRHLAGNNALFGNVNVRCHIRPLEGTVPESESKVQREDALMETLQLRDSAVEQRQPVAPVPAQQQQLPLQLPVAQQQQQQQQQLKSCLKKPMGDETATGTVSGGSGSSRGTPRVKFVLGGGEQLMVGNKNNFINNASFADGGASSSSHGMDFNSKNFQKVIPPPTSSILPVPLPPATAPFPNAPINMRYAEVAPRNTHSFNTNKAPALAPAVPISTNIDIAPQMLSLLTKCNDVVTNVRSFLGYVPYHPL